MRVSFVTLSLLACGSALRAQPVSTDIPRAEYLAVQDDEFRKMDANKDGQVAKAEVEAFERLRAAAAAQANNRLLFARLDTDRNGQLSPVEFLKLARPATAVNGQPMIAQFDTNKDGRINLIEHRAGKLAAFDRIDTDKDGIVTVAEMKAAGVVR